MSLLDQSLSEIVGADPSAPALSPASEALITRTVALALRLVQRAPESVVVTAAAAGSDAQLMHALADMFERETAANSHAQTMLDPVVPISERDAWLANNPKAAASVAQGLRDAAAGAIHDLGSFAERATDAADDEER